jgi:hypothetical protein
VAFGNHKVAADRGAVSLNLRRRANKAGGLRAGNEERLQMRSFPAFTFCKGRKPRSYDLIRLFYTLHD